MIMVDEYKYKFIHDRRNNMRKYVITAAAALVILTPNIGSVIAQQAAPELPGKVDPSRVEAGTYVVDPAHTLIGFRANHFGFNDYFGIFGDSTGTLEIDPANLSAAKVDITIPVNKLTTASEGLTAHMNRADFFETENYPNARFVSTKVTVDGTAAKIEGNLTIKGITKPVVLDASFTGAGNNPFNKKLTVGFEADTIVKRSDFGVNGAIPLVSDEVQLGITVAFEK